MISDIIYFGTRQSLLMLAISLQLIGCGGGNGTDENTFSDIVIGDGFFVDSAVEGLTFRPGGSSALESFPSKLTGVTDVNGKFFYAHGRPVVFSVGDVVLGEVFLGGVSAARVTPVDMVNNAMGVLEPAVQNIARFLQTIDYDGDPKNGIRITEAASDAARGVELDFNQPPADFSSNPKLVTLLTEINNYTMGDSSELISESVAIAHLDESLKVEFTNDMIVGKYFVDYQNGFDFGVMAVRPGLQFSTMYSGLFVSGRARIKTKEGFVWEINDGKVVDFGTSFPRIDLLAISDNRYLVRLYSFRTGLSATLSKSIPIAIDEVPGTFSIEGKYHFCKATVTFSANNTGNLSCEGDILKPFVWSIDEFGGLALSFSSVGVAEKDHTFTLITGDLQSGEFLVELDYELDAEENLVDVLSFTRLLHLPAM